MRAHDLVLTACASPLCDEAWAAARAALQAVRGEAPGQMDWMETTLERRKAPTSMWAGAKISRWSWALNYGPSLDRWTCCRNAVWQHLWSMSAGERLFTTC